jgi:hypothetical protein
MSLLGKVLAFLNVLAAIGFVCVAAMDYGKRQTWSHAVFMADLMIHGLPLDAQEVGPDGRPRVERISDPTKGKLFERAGGAPASPTQEDEVKRVEGQVGSAVASAGDAKSQAGALARILMPFAETNLQRERLFACFFWLGSPQNQKVLTDRFQLAFNQAAQKFREQPPPGRARPTFDELFNDALEAQGGEPAGPLAAAFVRAVTTGGNKPFAQAFDEAIEAQRAELDEQLKALFTEAKTGKRHTPNGGKLDPSERRRAVARLLFNLLDAVPDQAAAQAQGMIETPKFRRFLAVVGLREAVGAVAGQAENLTRIDDELAAERSRDMGRFARDHMARLAEVRQRAQEVADHDADLRRKNEQLLAQEELVKKRQAEVESYRTELAASRKETAERLQELRTMSQSLFAERVKLRDASRENQKLEKDLHKLEEGR